jgi:hypothetical protein
MSDPRTPTEAEILAMMDESDADYEAGRFVSCEEVHAMLKEGIAAIKARLSDENAPKVARFRR